MAQSDDHPRTSRLTGSTVELREPVTAGDRRLLLVDVVVREAGGLRKTSDGDVEPIHYKALDILDVTGLDQADEALTEVRSLRRAAQEERDGVRSLDDELAAQSYLIGFDCGHEIFYPEAILEREEADDGPGNDATYWRDQSGPPLVDGVAACPKCPGKRGALRKVTRSDLIPADGAAPAKGPDAQESPPEPWVGYSKATIGFVKAHLEELKLQAPLAAAEEEFSALVLAASTYEAANKHRGRLLDYFDELLDPQEVTAP